MINRLRFFKQVPRVMFGRGAFAKLAETLEAHRARGYVVFLIDHVHRKTGLRDRLPAAPGDLVIDVDTTHEPTTRQVDELRDSILQQKQGQLPSIVLGLGGGSTMDVAKAVSVMLTNPGSSTQYQGWDLVKNEAVPKMAIPTLSGTGAEASRTAVLTGPEKKFGINSDPSMFDWVLMDPDLLATVPNDQRFYTGMDCYIHSVEALEGSFINEFGRVFATGALDLCRKYFLKQGGTDEELMVASYAGGASVANSEVGVVHAMSYGLSLVLGYHHCEANCIVFDQMEEFYGKYLGEFREMMRLNQIVLDRNVTRGMTRENMDRMVAMTLKMERPLTSALGPDWRKILTEDKIRSIYARM